MSRPPASPRRGQAVLEWTVAVLALALVWCAFFTACGAWRRSFVHAERRSQAWRSAWGPSDAPRSP